MVGVKMSSILKEALRVSMDLILSGMGMSGGKAGRLQLLGCFPAFHDTPLSACELC